MLLDLHMHSAYSEDAEPYATVEANCLAAIDCGLSAIALTDHKEFYFTRTEAELDMDALLRDVAQCQSTFSGALTLLSGIELGQIHASHKAQAFIEAYDFDEVIGSLHVRRANDTDIYFQNYTELNHQAFLKEYFDDLLCMVQCGRFDILAHIDYPLRVMKLPDNEPSFLGFEKQIEAILRELIDREIALEINGASLFGWQKRAGPPRFVLDMYRNLGGAMLTVGSDSHKPENIGRGIQECITCAKDAGFDELVLFRKRKPETVTI